MSGRCTLLDGSSTARVRRDGSRWGAGSRCALHSFHPWLERRLGFSNFEFSFPLLKRRKTVSNVPCQLQLAPPPPLRLGVGAPLDHLAHLFGQVRDFLPTLDAAHTAMLGYALASMPKNPVRLDAAFHFRFARHVSDNLASWDCSPNDLVGMMRVRSRGLPVE